MPAAAVVAAAVISAAASNDASRKSANAAKDAANIGAQSSQDQLAEARRQFDIQQQNQAPFLQRGNQAADRLQFLMGLPGGATNGMSAPDRNAIAAQLRPNFLSQQSSGSGGLYKDMYGNIRSFTPAEVATALGQPNGMQPGNGGFYQQNQSGDWKTQTWNPVSTVSDVVDTSGLNAAADAEYQKQLQAYQAPQTAQQSAQASDPQFGRLTKDFSLQDILNDPVYNFSKDFGLQQGNQAIDRRSLASGNWDSGATLKALDKFNQGYASQGAGDAFNRYTTQNTNLYNRLGQIAGTGQTASNALNQASQNYTNNAMNAMSGGANAQMGGIIGAGNARAAGMGAQATTLSNLFNNPQIQQGIGNMFGGQPAATNWDNYSNTGMRYSDANALGGSGNTTGYQSSYGGVS